MKIVAIVEFGVDTSSPLPSIPRGETRAAFPRSRRIHACAPPATVKVGRSSAARIAGCLDRRLIRRATLDVSSALGMPSIPAGLRPILVRRLGDFRPAFPAPALSEGARRGGYRDACSIARSLRGLLDACSIPRRGHPVPRRGA